MSWLVRQRVFFGSCATLMIYVPICTTLSEQIRTWQCFRTDRKNLRVSLPSILVVWYVLTFWVHTPSAPDPARGPSLGTVSLRLGISPSRISFVRKALGIQQVRVCGPFVDMRMHLCWMDNSDILFRAKELKPSLSTIVMPQQLSWCVRASQKMHN